MQAHQVERFKTAQSYEVSWWVRHINTELRPLSRDWMVGYQDQVGRGHMAGFGLRQANRFWTASPPAISGKLLDLGSSIVSFFEGKPIEVIAVEPSLSKLAEQLPELVVIGQSRNVFYHDGEIYDIPDNSVQNVWCVNMLDHTPDWETILDVEIPRVLRPGGKFFFGIDCKSGPGRCDAGHLVMFQPEMLYPYLNKHFVEQWSRDPVQNSTKWRWNYIGVRK